MSQLECNTATPAEICWLLGGDAGSYPPVLGADDQQAALSEGAEGNALTALTVDGFGLFLKHRIQVLNRHSKHTHTHKREPKMMCISKLENSRNTRNVNHFLCVFPGILINMGEKNAVHLSYILGEISYVILNLNIKMFSNGHSSSLKT